MSLNSWGLAGDGENCYKFGFAALRKTWKREATAGGLLGMSRPVIRCVTTRTEDLRIISQRLGWFSFGDSLRAHFTTNS